MKTFQDFSNVVSHIMLVHPEKIEEFSEYQFFVACAEGDRLKPVTGFIFDPVGKTILLETHVKE